MVELEGAIERLILLGALVLQYSTFNWGHSVRGDWLHEKSEWLTDYWANDDIGERQLGDITKRKSFCEKDVWATNDWAMKDTCSKSIRPVHTKYC